MPPGLASFVHTTQTSLLLQQTHHWKWCCCTICWEHLLFELTTKYEERCGLWRMGMGVGILVDPQPQVRVPKICCIVIVSSMVRRHSQSPQSKKVLSTFTFTFCTAKAKCTCRNTYAKAKEAKLIILKTLHLCTVSCAVYTRIYRQNVFK